MFILKRKGKKSSPYCLGKYGGVSIECKWTHFRRSCCLQNAPLTLSGGKVAINLLAFRKHSTSPKGLCTSCSFCLESFSLDIYRALPWLHLGLYSNVTSSERSSCDSPTHLTLPHHSSLYTLPALIFSWHFAPPDILFVYCLSTPPRL